MPLVDYASSDEESEGESEVVEKTVGDLTGKKQVSDDVDVKENTDNDNGELFSSLPKPKKSFSFLDDSSTYSKVLLHKGKVSVGKKESVKITVPSISEFDDEKEEPQLKKLKPSTKGAGLFSILPPPKNNTVKLSNRSLVPQVVSQNQFKQSLKKQPATSKGVHKAGLKTSKDDKDDDDDDDDDDVTLGSSFFGSSLLEKHSDSESVNSKNENTVFDRTIDSSSVGCSLPVDINPPGQHSNPNQFENINEDMPVCPSNSSQVPEVVSASDNPLALDEKALQILCGNKKKRHQMPMNIIDLSGEEVLPDSKEWLLKQFTEEKRGRGHSHKKSNGPSSMSRRKHQITYLAYQAKEQELELQNQWAINRMTRKQTQSKYGF